MPTRQSVCRMGYHHWSYGKHFLSTEKSYTRGQMGLAYEIVINSDPCIAYLMEEKRRLHAGIGGGPRLLWA